MAPNCQSMVMEVGCPQVETVRMRLIVCQETDCNVMVIFAMDVVMFLKCNSITRLECSKMHPASSEHRIVGGVAVKIAKFTVNVSVILCPSSIITETLSKATALMMAECCI